MNSGRTSTKTSPRSGVSRLPKLSDLSTVQVLKDQNQTLKKENQIMKETLEQKNFELSQLKTENAKLLEMPSSQKTDNEQSHQRLLNDLQRQISSEQETFDNFEKAASVIQTSISKQTTILERQVQILQQSYKSVAVQLASVKQKNEELQRKNEINLKVQETLDSNLNEIKGKLDSEREKFQEEIKNLRNQIEKKLDGSNEAVKSILSDVKAVTKAVEGIQMPAILMEQLTPFSQQVSDISSSDEKNKIMVILQQKEKLLAESQKEKERVVQHLQDQIQLRDQKINVLQTTKAFSSQFAGSNVSGSGSVSDIPSEEDPLVRQLQALLQSSQIVLEKTMKEKQELLSKVNLDDEKLALQEQEIGRLSGVKKDFEIELNNIKASYRQLFENFEYLSRNLTNEIVVTEFVFPPFHENKIEIIQHNIDHAFYRDLIIEFVSSYPELLTVAEQINSQPQEATEKLFSLLKQHMESSITVIAELKKQIESLCDSTKIMKQASDQKNSMLKMTNQVESANKQIADAQLQLKREKIERDREREQKEHEISELRKQIEEHSKMAGKLKSLQNLYNTTLEYHTSYESTSNEKIEKLTSSNAQLKEQLSRVEKENVALTQQNKKNELDIKKMVEELSLIQGGKNKFEKDSVSSSLDKYKKKVQFYDKKYHQLQDEYNKIEVQLKDCQKEKEHFQEQAQKLSQQLLMANETHENVQRALKNKLREISEQRDSLKKDHFSIASEHESASFKLNRKLEAAEKEKEELSRQIESLTEKVAEVKSANFELQKNLESQASKCAQAVEDARAQKESLNFVIGKLSKQLKSAENEVKSLKDELEKSRERSSDRRVVEVNSFETSH